ncbi:UNVERIFIED_CONTAM: hypothetical protein PYX00_006468 [Menopon gallinae]|uniref:Uncharacterized protein n=1 Tax=Menopon gallinae TaxID=328185 RepID=A0AAW2HVZ4_9NEOP
MRLKEVVVQDVVVPVQKLNCNARLNNEANRNGIQNSDDNCTNLYCQQWSNCGDLVSDDNNFPAINTNNNIAIEKEEVVECNRRAVTCPSPVSSPEDDSYGDYEGQSSSSLDVSPQGDEYHCFSQEEITDSDFSDDGNRYPNRGIVNPNYPGFQEFANDLEDSSDDEIGSNINNINNNNNNNNNNGNVEISESVNHLDSVENFQKAFYDKPKFDIGEDAKPENRENAKDSLSQSADSGVSSGVTTDNELECPENGNNWFVQEDIVTTAVFPVSGIYETTVIEDDSDSSPSEEKTGENMAWEENHLNQPRILDEAIPDCNKLNCKDPKVLKETENGMKKEEKMQINVTTKNNLKAKPDVTYRAAKEKPRCSSGNRRSLPLTKDKGSNIDLGFFDVYNIETAMPKIDIDAIESHLKAAKEEERR